MAGDKDFERHLEIIERTLAELDAASDPGLRASVQRLVESILELHGRSLERLLEIVHRSGIAGPPIIEQLGRDPLVSSLMLLHSLHPLTLEERVLQALEKVQRELAAKRAEVELIGIDDGAIRVRLLGGPEEKTAVERAILDAAPDMTALDVEGAVESVVGFVPLASLRATERSRSIAPQSPPVLVPGA